MKPDWLKKRLNSGGVLDMKSRLRGLNLHTVCEEARCPNLSECFSKGVATVMIMGDICTRACKFCAVATGRPAPLDPQEPYRVAQWVCALELKHVVITSVDRDDLEDLGAIHFAETVHQTKIINPKTIVEVLTPDFQGIGELIDEICYTKPIIYNHNIETVKRLTPSVRSASKYERSLSVISWVKQHHPDIVTKSGIMLGLGETRDEILESMEDLVNHGCDLLTLGQYLQPTKKHLLVVEYIHPDRFLEYKEWGLKLGFKGVASGPFIRSSYLADEQFEKIAV